MTRSTDDDSIQVWEDDPGTPTNTRVPVSRPRPRMDRKPLAVGIRDQAPTADSTTPGSAAFRYWTAAEALRRSADAWGSLVPDQTSWHATVGSTLRADLDLGDDLNAYYTRTGLEFYHREVAGATVFTGESPDVVCHELGHAVLDAVRPQLWDAASAEVAAFHESFGDVSALLSGLHMESVREQALVETDGHIDRSSRLSRVAEELGWAIRQSAPQAVDADCLRNAANRFFYRNPVFLPPRAPAAELSSAPHSFSRVFTGAFLSVLAGVFQAQPQQDSAGLLQAGLDGCALLVQAILQAPVVPAYYSQVAAHMVAADAAMFGGRYGTALRIGFVRHGVLSPEGATSLTAETIAPHATAIAEATVPVVEPPLAAVEIVGGQYGISTAFSCRAPGQAARFSVTGAAPDRGSEAPTAGRQVAESFVEDLFRNGKVDVPTRYRTAETIVDDETTKSHELTDQGGGLQLVRRLFD